MGLNDLSELDIINGVATTFYVLASIILGLRISLKYFKYRRKELITVGISMFFGSSVYWSSCIAFFTILLFDYEPGLSFHLYMHMLVPIGFIFWLYSFSLLVYPELLKKIVTISSAICIVYDIFLYIFIVNDPDSLGRRTGKFINETYLYINIYLVFSGVLMLTTMIIFIRTTFLSDSPKLKLRGKFLSISLLFIGIGAIIGLFLADTALVIILIRTLLIIGSITGYIGWIMPDKIFNLLAKKEIDN